MNKHGTVIVSVLLAAAVVAAPAARSANRIVRTIPDSTALGSGPFKIVPSMDPNLPAHTIYAPRQLSVLGAQKLPIVAWAEGGCLGDGTRYRWFLSEIASHGYLVVANGAMGPLEDQVWLPPPPGKAIMPNPKNLAPAATRASQLIEAIDWAVAENVRPGSRYLGRINTAKIAVMGMSCGGIQAIEAGAEDPRVVTTVMWNSGLFPDPSTNASAGGASLAKSYLSRLHGSVAYISGDESDIAFENANDDFKRLQGVAALRAIRKRTRHEGTYGERNGGDFGRVAVAWLDWRLKADQSAARLFTGPDCGLCSDPRWTVSLKDLH